MIFRNVRRWGPAAALFFLAVPAGLAAETPKPNQHLSRATFQSLARLAPRCESARPVNLTEAGYKLWAQNQLKLPAAGIYEDGDFNGDGVREAAAVMNCGAKTMGVIAAKTSSGWSAEFIFELSGPGVLFWDGQKFQLTDNSFIVWRNGRYQIEAGVLASIARTYALNAYRRVMVKITYIGEREKSVRGFLFYGLEGAPEIVAFAPFEDKTGLYANDASLLFDSLTLTHSQMRELIGAFKDFAGGISAAKRAPGAYPYAVSVVDAARGKDAPYYNVFLTKEELRAFLSRAAKAWEESDSFAAARALAYAK